MEEKITCIIAAYNEEELIKKCLESVTSAKPDEIIVVDDGSTDNTSNIIKQFHVKYYRTNHVGFARARNVGIKHAKGSIICFVDADIIVNKKFFKQLKKDIKNVDMVDFTGHSIVTNWVSRYNHLIRNEASKKNGSRHAMAYKREIIEYLNPKYGYYADSELTKRLLKKGCKLGRSKAKTWHHESDNFSVFFGMGKSLVNCYNWQSLAYVFSSLTPLFAIWALYRAVKFHWWKVFFAEWIAKIIMSFGFLYGLAAKK